MISWFVATFQRIVAAALAMVGALIAGILGALTAPFTRPRNDDADAREEEE